MTYLPLVMDLIRGFMDEEIPVLGEIHSLQCIPYKVDFV
jgi:hypothetical protein